MTVYRDDDGPIKEPEKYFKVSELSQMKPYHIFTGVGFLAKYRIPHECDCPYCEVEYDDKELFFKTCEELGKWLKNNGIDLEEIKEVFYAHAVRQNFDDALKIVV